VFVSGSLGVRVGYKRDSGCSYAWGSFLDICGRDIFYNTDTKWVFVDVREHNSVSCGCS
jgi:hypothetical protein